MAGNKLFSWPLRVYYQHTDAGGVVFHANYLGFMECARTELLHSLGFDLGLLAQRDRVLFVVHRASLVYHRPAMLGDLLTVTAAPGRVGRARIEFVQQVLHDDEVLTDGIIMLACVDADNMKPVGVPKTIRDKLEGKQ